MRTIRVIAAAAIAAACVFPARPVLAQGSPPPEAINKDRPKQRATYSHRLKGRFLVNGDPRNIVTIMRVVAAVDEAYTVVADQWEGVGFFDGKTYWGVFRYSRSVSPPELAGVRGIHTGILHSNGALAIHGDFPDGRAKQFDAIWKPDPAPPEPIPPFDPPGEPRDNELPKLDDYVYVEELPEAIAKTPPVYPQAARELLIEGTVLVQALVGADGTVKDTKVIKSIPRLDEAAVASVRKWVFKPASAKGKPVAVWVAIPVRFSLK